MKKIYSLVCIFLLTGSTAFSQTYLLKSEISPIESSRDSRFAVQATVMDNDTWCKVTWPDPETSSTELWYDDDDADDFFLFAFPGSMNANKFSPNFYPFIVSGGRIYVGDGSFPGPFLGTSFQVFVYDDDGEDGLPGNPLDSITVTVSNYEWVEFEGMTASITEGDFYLVMKQTAPSPNTAPVGVDLDNPTYHISYTRYNDNQWVPAPVQDFMIRAWVVGYQGSSRNIDYFKIDRFSGFNPDISPLLGQITALDTTSASEYDDYEWNSLSPGWYAYGVKTHFSDGEWSDYDVSNVVTKQVNFYIPSCFYQADTGNRPLIFCPPLDSSGAVPLNFIGYNLKNNGNLIAFLPPTTTSYDPDWSDPVNILYVLKAVYDLGIYGLPGETEESDSLAANYMIRYGNLLEFNEDWSSGDFTENGWTIEGQNWVLNEQEGNPSPAAEFKSNPVLLNYNESLESFPLLADSIEDGRIYLDFDIQLNSVNPTGTELLAVEIMDWQSQQWYEVKEFENLEGSFDWLSEHIDITEHARSNVFKIRFSAKGENSGNVLNWLIDNIYIYQFCHPPENLSSQANGELHGIVLTWDKPIGMPVDMWIEWDDGDNSGNSIGTGGAAEFDVAARWEPSQLLDFEGSSVTEIGFFPDESAATYRVRVWQGEGAENMITDQLVTYVVPGQWNYITLDSPPLIDIAQELWVGYYVNTPIGYPAGVDDGPAVDGYGNMMNFGGWQTLLQINPELDYNWNISAHIETIDDKKNDSRQFLKYAIYRHDENEYYFRAYAEDEYFLDDSALCVNTYFLGYKVMALYGNGSYTCESDFSNETVEICEGITDINSQPFVDIYPNPCDDILKIESSEEMGLLYLYNPFGELIFKKKVDDKQLEIPVSDYLAGVYLIKVETENRVISKKVMVVH